MRRLLLPLVLLATSARGVAQTPRPYTHADTLRGSYTSPGRAWWDVSFYDLHVAVNPADSSIRGHNAITYRVTGPGATLQIDLMTPLEVDSMLQAGRRATYRRDGNAFFVTPTVPARPGDVQTLTVYYHGRPQIAKRPPWEGGFSWSTDSLGRPWVVTTDQGMGASVWWPNKDTQADEPDSQRVVITVPDSLIDVSNGRLRSVRRQADGATSYEWFVTNPVNNYAIAVAAGRYTHFSDLYRGEGGLLTLDFWPLDYHLDAAKRQFAQVKPMLQCFEHWFGPYPWYEDGYKLIEVSNNGMEHQSAVAYGNGYANGYQRRDMSGTGLGLEWDFIIVHESAHEWWGNNITTKDIADMWVHESFATYAEGLYTECRFGKAKGAAYLIGLRRNIRNDRPVVPDAYGVNAQGSGDMYPKGAQMLHMIRQLVGDDEKWRSILRGLNQTFRHQTVTGAQVQQYLAQQTGLDLSKIFEQYLRTTRVPVLEYRLQGRTLSYRWADAVPGFDLPLPVTIGGVERTLRPTPRWQSLRLPKSPTGPLTVDPDFYVTARDVAAAAAR
ncbi:MAG TPA: M1 family metallopeptidase [Gemmatimonadales bacterium]|nr:M1 family metallopeptidase [Gemmatimonadales bacterium]